MYVLSRFSVSPEIIVMVSWDLKQSINQCQSAMTFPSRMTCVLGHVLSVQPAGYEKWGRFCCCVWTASSVMRLIHLLVVLLRSETIDFF